MLTQLLANCFACIARFFKMLSDPKNSRLTKNAEFHSCACGCGCALAVALVAALLRLRSYGCGSAVALLLLEVEFGS